MRLLACFLIALVYLTAALAEAPVPASTPADLVAKSKLRELLNNFLTSCNGHRKSPQRFSLSKLKNQQQLSKNDYCNLFSEFLENKTGEEIFNRKHLLRGLNFTSDEAMLRHFKERNPAVVFEDVNSFLKQYLKTHKAVIEPCTPFNWRENQLGYVLGPTAPAAVHRGLALAICHLPRLDGYEYWDIPETGRTTDNKLNIAAYLERITGDRDPRRQIVVLLPGSFNREKCGNFNHGCAQVIELVWLFLNLETAGPLHFVFGAYDALTANQLINDFAGQSKLSRNNRFIKEFGLATIIKNTEPIDDFELSYFEHPEKALKASESDPEKSRYLKLVDLEDAEEQTTPFFAKYIRDLFLNR